MTDDGQTNEDEQPERKQWRVPLWRWVVLVVAGLLVLDFWPCIAAPARAHKAMTMCQEGRDWGAVKAELVKFRCTVETSEYRYVTHTIGLHRIDYFTRLPRLLELPLSILLNADPDKTVELVTKYLPVPFTVVTSGSVILEARF
jgi:hypothetical protein